MPSRRKAFINGRPLTFMRRSKVVCILMADCFDALARGRETSAGPCSFVADGSIAAEASRKRRPIRLNRFFGPFTETFLDVVADVGQRLISQSCHFTQTLGSGWDGSIKLNGCASESLAR